VAARRGPTAQPAAIYAGRKQGIFQARFPPGPVNGLHLNGRSLSLGVSRGSYERRANASAAIRPEAFEATPFTRGMPLAKFGATAWECSCEISGEMANGRLACNALLFSVFMESISMPQGI